MKIEQVIKQNNDERLDIKFDITKLHRKTNKNFSLFDTLKFAPYNEKFLIKQPIKDSCLLISTYNAFPKLFNYNEKKFLKVLSKFQKEHTIPKLLKMYKSLKETDTKIESLINIEKPVIISVAYAYSNNSHAVAIFGYDNENYAYFENGINDAILISTINSLNMQLSLLILQNKVDRTFFEKIGYEEFYDFRKNWENKLQNEEYNNWIINYFSNDVFAKFGKLTVIKKDFLDMTIKGKKLITYSRQYNFTEDLLNNPDTFSNFNFIDPIKNVSLKDLTERLNKISF